MAKIWKNFRQNYPLSSPIERLMYWIIGVSVIFFLLKVISISFYSNALFWVGLSSNATELLYKPFTLVTYSFVHAGPIHLLFNIVVLYFVSQLFSTYFSAKEFVTCYFLGAFLGGVFFVIGSFVLPVSTLLVGASAAIICPLMALVFYNPKMEIRLMLVGVVKIWYIAAFIIILDIVQLSGSNVGGHLAHLGGACMGFLYIKYIRNTPVFSNLQAKVSSVFTNNNKGNLKKVYRNTKSKTFDKAPSASNQAKIDSILEKISKSGYESLTKEEKSFLFTSGKR
ncbi:rhomboid family intramembrane serine protease [Myroides sp. LJL116]